MLCPHLRGNYIGDSNIFHCLDCDRFIYKPKNMKKTLSFLLIFCLTCLMTACPKKTIETAKRESARLAGYANQGVNVTRELFREKFLTVEQKDKIAEGFIVLAKAGQTFDETVKNLEKTYGSNVPRSEVEKLFEVFNSLVVGKFLDVLKELKIVSDNRIGEVVELLRSAILIIAKGFGKGSALEKQLEAV